MPDSRLMVHKAAVLGAGVMGAQIAAHLANAGVPTLLFELAARGEDKNATSTGAIAALREMQPPPLAGRKAADFIQPANYDDHLALLQDCDLVIEAIAERMDFKRDLYGKVTPYLGARTFFATNTSGLSVEKLAEACPPHLRARFCGVHFFNPPRYMHLVELIPCQETNAAVLDGLEHFLVTTLGKSVVRAKDTPTFVANRVGVFSMLATIANARRYGIRFDIADDLTGLRLGRAKSATFRTLDVVGLDTFAHVVRTMCEELAQDPWHELYSVPAWLSSLIEAGALGAKTKGGIYRREGKDLHVFDPLSSRYVVAGETADESVVVTLGLENPAQRLERLRATDHPQAQFLWACFRDLFHYVAFHLSAIARSARDVDLAMRWGFGWNIGPFELWQAANWRRVACWVEEDIDAGRTLARVPLPLWAREPTRIGVHHPEGSYDAAGNVLVGRSGLNVYRRQIAPASLIGEDMPQLGETVFENSAVRAFTTGDEVAVVSFKTKMHVISPEVLEGLNDVIALAEEHFRGLVIWQPDPPFSVGVRLESLRSAAVAGDWNAVDCAIRLWQATSQRMRYSKIPTVAAIEGYVLGAGCELAMHCDRVVAALESRVGLVAAGAGLLPAAGGCKEVAVRASQESARDLVASIQDYFMMIVRAQMAGSGIEAQECGLLRPSDVVVFNARELLHVAKQQVFDLADSGYSPPLRGTRLQVAGCVGAVSLRGLLMSLLDRHVISEEEFEVGSGVAEVVTGGDVESGAEVDEEWILQLERQHFIRLLKSPQTQARMTTSFVMGGAQRR